VEHILGAIRERFGEGWGQDAEATRRFSADVESLLRGVEGVHLVGDPAIEEGRVEIRLWVDRPLRDLMSADRLAYEVFGRLSEEFFYAERRFEPDGLRYPFVTGSPRQGNVGALHLFGPHAAAFAERFRRRVSGGLRYHA